MEEGETTKQKIKLQYMATEPRAAPPDGKSLLEGWHYLADEPLLDGPVSRRVAVVDIDPETGAVAQGAKFLAATGGKKISRYLVADEKNLDSADFQQVSVFGAVMKMIDMFEEEDVLGRKLRWAFKGEQLLVVPRAGVMKNAFYHRDSRSLQFFFFEDPKEPGRNIYTCLSPDIVAHETAHAILDGIAPDLYDAVSPQSLAIHEAIADIGAVMFATRSNRLTREVLERTEGNLELSSAFNQIAQQFGAAVYGAGHCLRDLSNKRTMDKVSHEPHELSEVLSGALYAVMVALMPVAIRELIDKKETATQLSVSGAALHSAAQRLKRLAFRGLDYLPPGEVSFADYGRAIVAADTSSNPDDHDLRDIAKAEFVRRQIVSKASELDWKTPPGLELPDDLDLALLMTSDWAAYQFVERFRRELLVPQSISFEVRPRLDVTKKTFRHQIEDAALTREFILKVAWRENKATDRGGGLYDEISVMHGTTLAINWESKKVCGFVSTSPLDRSQKTSGAGKHDRMRLRYLQACLNEGLIEIGTPQAQLLGKTLRLRSVGQMLHMAEH